MGRLLGRSFYLAWDCCFCIGSNSFFGLCMLCYGSFFEVEAEEIGF